MSMSFIGNSKPLIPKALAPSVTASKGVTASKSVTSSKGVSPDAIERKALAAKKAATPPAKSSSKAPTKAPTKTPTKSPVGGNLALDADSQLAINMLEGDAETKAALRAYQEEAAKRNLQDSLRIIDRNALDQYKGISDDYAGRGMLRSGGYVRADDRAYQGVQDQKVMLNNALTDMLRENQITAAGEAESLGNQKANIMQKFLAQLMANKTSKIGAK